VPDGPPSASYLYRDRGLCLAYASRPGCREQVGRCLLWANLKSTGRWQCSDVVVDHDHRRIGHGPYQRRC